jgi:peptide deformylase
MQNDKEGEEWSFNEGCLSILMFVKMFIEILRLPLSIVKKISWWKQGFDGLIARVIQHEYDHIEGILFTDKISSLKKRLIQRNLKILSKEKHFKSIEFFLVKRNKSASV